jgi:hypothetical protein
LSVAQGAQSIEPLQSPLWQSRGSKHFLPFAQAVQFGPPQLTSVLPSSVALPSVHAADTHLPAPSHTVPPLSEHASPIAVFVTTQALPVHATVAHRVPVAVQSSVWTHATHLPLPSQTLPPASEQLAPDVASVGVHAPPEHAGVLHIVPVGWQSVAARQATHAPLALQSMPPESLQLMPEATFDVPQVCALHVAV